MLSTSQISNTSPPFKTIFKFHSYIDDTYTFVNFSHLVNTTSTQHISQVKMDFVRFPKVGDKKCLQISLVLDINVHGSSRDVTDFGHSDHLLTITIFLYNF